MLAVVFGMAVVLLAPGAGEKAVTLALVAQAVLAGGGAVGVTELRRKAG